MTKQQFINAFWNEVKDENRRKRINPTNITRAGLPRVPAGGYAIPAPQGSKETVLEDWWRLISNNANPGAAGGILGRAAGNEPAFPANYFEAASFTMPNPHSNNGAGIDFAPIRADRTGFNGVAAANSGWHNARFDENAGAFRFDDELAGFIFGRLFNAGWEAGDIALDETANAILLVQPNGGAVGRGISNSIRQTNPGVTSTRREGDYYVVSPGEKTWKKAFQEVDSSASDEEVFRWQRIRFGDPTVAYIGYNNRQEFLTATEAANLRKNGWKIEDLTSAAGGWTVANNVVSGAVGDLFTGKNAILAGGSRKDCWLEAFNGQLDALGTAKVTSNVAEEWMNLRWAKDASGGNNDLAMGEKINAIQAATLYNNGWKPHHFNNWGGALRPVGGGNLNGVPVLNLVGCAALPNRVTTWRTQFAAGFVAAGGLARNMVGDGSNDDHNKIMDEWLKLLEPTSDGGKNLVTYKLVTPAAPAGAPAVNQGLTANIAGRLCFNDWKIEQIFEAGSISGVAQDKNLPRVTHPGTGTPLVGGDAISLIGKVGNAFIVAFRNAGGVAGSCSDDQIRQWMNKGLNGVESAEAYKQGWEVSEINNKGRGVINGKEFNPINTPRSTALEQAKEEKKDDGTKKDDKNEAKTNLKKAEDNLKEIVERGNKLNLSSATKSEISSIISELKNFSDARASDMRSVAWVKNSGAKGLLEKLESAKEKAPEKSIDTSGTTATTGGTTATTGGTTATTGGTTAIKDDGNGAVTEAVVNSVKTKIEEALKGKGINEKEFVKDFAKHNKQFENAKNLQEILNTANTKQDLDSLKGKILSHIEEEKALTHWQKWKWLYFGLGAIGFIAVGIVIWKMFFSNEPKEGEE